MRGHWRRLVFQIVIGIAMLAVNAINEDLYLVMVSISLILAPVIIWTVFAVLLWLSNKAPDIKSLAEGVDDMMTLAIASTVGATLAIVTLGRLTGLITQPIGSYVTVGLGYIVVAVAIPAIAKLRTVRNVYLPVVMLRRGLPNDSDGDAVRVGDVYPGRVVHVDHVIAATEAEIDQGHRDPVDEDRLPPPVAESGS